MVLQGCICIAVIQSACYSNRNGECLLLLNNIKITADLSTVPTARRLLFLWILRQLRHGSIFRFVETSASLQLSV